MSKGEEVDFYDMYPLNQVIKLICAVFYLFRWDSAATEQTPCKPQFVARGPLKCCEAGSATFRARPRALLWDSQEGTFRDI